MLQKQRENFPVLVSRMEPLIPLSGSILPMRADSVKDPEILDTPRCRGLGAMLSLTSMLLGGVGKKTQRKHVCGCVSKNML